MDLLNLYGRLPTHLTLIRETQLDVRSVGDFDGHGDGGEFSIQTSSPMNATRRVRYLDIQVTTGRPLHSLTNHVYAYFQNVETKNVCERKMRKKERSSKKEKIEIDRKCFMKKKK